MATAGLTSRCVLQGQLSPATRGAYRDCLGRLDLQYAKLLVSSGPGWGLGQAAGLQPADTHPACPQNSSKGRLRSLESLYSFVAAATKELMWLSEKEEEEVGFDWSERNTNMAAKKESYSVRRAAGLLGPSVTPPPAQEPLGSQSSPASGPMGPTLGLACHLMGDWQTLAWP